MALTQAQFVTEIQAATGRENDTLLVTAARCTRYMNEAQDKIVRRCTGHLDLEYSHATAITLVAGTVSYSFAALSPTVKFPLRLYYMDTDASIPIDYMETSDFDDEHPYPTDTSGIPCVWTRRSSAIEVWPPASSAEAGNYLRLVYTKSPTDFSTASTAATGTMTDADQGIVYYCVSEAFKAIGKHDEAAQFKSYFYEWLDEYQRDYDGRYHADMQNIL